MAGSSAWAQLARISNTELHDNSQSKGWRMNATVSVSDHLVSINGSAGPSFNCCSKEHSKTRPISSPVLSSSLPVSKYFFYAEEIRVHWKALWVSSELWEIMLSLIWEAGNQPSKLGNHRGWMLPWGTLPTTSREKQSVTKQRISLKDSCAYSLQKTFTHKALQPVLLYS